VFTLDQLQDFIAVAEEKSFGKAAKRLQMTQPPLSRQIQRLERTIGFAVFTRTSRSVNLTPAGSVFLEEARRIIRLAEAAPLRAHRVALGSAGRVKVGFTAVAALNVFGEWIKHLHEKHPDIDIDLTEMVTSAQIDALQANELDVGLIRGAANSTVLESLLVHAEPLVVALPTTHQLAGLGRKPTLAEIAEFPIVTYGPDPSRYFHELVVSTFHGAGLAPYYAQYVTQVSSQLVLVEAGIGISLVPRSASRLNPRSIAFLEVEDMPDNQVELHGAWRRDSRNPVMPAVLAALDDVSAYSVPSTPATSVMSVGALPASMSSNP
jgi:DNA-binding transcriptional LysR family regulator